MRQTVSSLGTDNEQIPLRNGSLSHLCEVNTGSGTVNFQASETRMVRPAAYTIFDVELVVQGSERPYNGDDIRWGRSRKANGEWRVCRLRAEVGDSR